MQSANTIGTHGCGRLDRLVDEAPHTGTRIQLQSEFGNSTRKGERSFAYRFSGVCHAFWCCTEDAARVTDGSGTFQWKSDAAPRDWRRTCAPPAAFAFWMLRF